VDRIPINLPPSCIKINLIEFQKSLSLPEISDSPEEQHDRQCQVGLEEIFSSSQLGGERRCNGDEELRRGGDEDEEEAEPGAVDAANGLEGDFVDGAAGVFPCGTEADMCLWELVKKQSTWRSNVAASPKGYLQRRWNPM
jgi:hypothetical protein